MKQLFMFLSLILVMTSCKKKEQGHDYRLPQGLKGYFNYQKGSYWVFIDSLNGSVDSFYAGYYNDTVLYHTQDGVTSSGEAISIGFHEFRGNSVDTFIEWNFNITTPDNNSDFGTTFYGFTDLTVGYPFDLHSSTNEIHRMKYDSVSINNVYYYDVYYVDNINNRTGDYFTATYFNLKYGFIKITIDTKYIHQILELQQSHIIH